MILFSSYQPYLSELKEEFIKGIDLAIITQNTHRYRDGTIQTQDELTSIGVESLYLLQHHIERCIAHYAPNKNIETLWMFANKTPRTEQDNVFHDHPGYDIGGCYYVSSPKYSGGFLEFKDPYLILEPIESGLVLFDAKYMHRVTEWDNDEPRYSIAFNCKFK